MVANFTFNSLKVDRISLYALKTACQLNFRFHRYLDLKIQAKGDKWYWWDLGVYNGWWHYRLWANWIRIEFDDFEITDVNAPWKKTLRNSHFNTKFYVLLLYFFVHLQLLFIAKGPMNVYVLLF